MGQILPTLEDYTTECGSVPLSFIQMLASCIRGYHDLAGELHYRINGSETAISCLTLTDFWTCDTSHIDPERQLVENTFALDECGYLTWKIFANSDNDWEDYGECGEVPLTLIEMLARCIYADTTTTRLNAVIDGDACTEVTALLSCVTNQIESERLLVNNVFAVDDCGKQLIKFYANTSSMTDYHTECNDIPLSFYQLLAMCIVLYDGHYYINCASTNAYCDDFHDFWTCDNGHLDPERALVENVFAVDDCGNLALKVFNNNGDSREQ